MTTATRWPAVPKTKAMRLCELANRKSTKDEAPDIRDIILDALSAHKRDSDAAYAIGILHTTLSHWITRLGIYYEAEEIRRNRAA